MKYVASVSFGKDSTAMILKLLEDREREQYPLDKVIFYDTGVEFNAIYSVRDQVVPLIREKGIEYVECRPSRPFLFDMGFKEVHHRDGTIGTGYGWCGKTVRWGTSMKRDTIKKYVSKDDIQYIGIAADEKNRCKDDNIHRYPLIDFNMTEKDCLDYCHEKGIFWMEDGVELYSVLDRVSCWCCQNKNQKELQAMHDHLPKYYNMLRQLEQVNGPMNKSRGLLPK